MPARNNANIDISRYVALGDSITSGYTNGALFYEGQVNSYANLLAKQFKLIGGGEFKQPLMLPNSVGVGFNGNARLALKRKNEINGVSNDAPAYVASCGDLAVFSETIFEKQGPFNDISVPGAKLTSLVVPGLGNPANGVGNFNPFFTRMASNPFNASILSDSLALNPTFFSLFIGNNDILGYASSGGTTDRITDLLGELGIGFVKSLEHVVTALTHNGAKGVIANLANIADVPYFNAIPFDGLIINAHQAKELNHKFKDARIHFKEGNNPFVVQDSYDKIRLAEKGELIILEIQLDSDRVQYLNANLPIPKKYFLTVNEVTKIKQALNSYNEVIESIAAERNLALVDVNAFTKTLKQEINYDTVNLCASYNSKSVFSFDGLHLNAYGQAMLTNIFIKAINSHYHTNIPVINAINYIGK